MAKPENSINELLKRHREGDSEALSELLSLVYDELKKIAAARMRAERANHTLQTTGLVNEACVRLMQGGEIQIESQRHLYALAAQVMRRVLVDYARSKYGRDGKRRVLVTSFQEDKHARQEEEVDIPALDEALDKLTRSSPRASQIVELRMFSGMEVNEIAEVLGISPATVKRDWAAARLWLFHEMKKKAA